MTTPNKGIRFRKTRSGITEVCFHPETFIPFLQSFRQNPKGWVSFLQMENENQKPEGATHRLIPQSPLNYKVEGPTEFKG